MDDPQSRTLDSLDARRVLANVTSELFDGDVARSRIDRFVLLDKLGSGGMGVVYSAFDPKLDRRVAIKILHRAEDDRGTRQARLLSEARALAKLSHPNVVTVYEVGEVDDRVYVAMELVDGQPLDEWLTESRPWPEVVEVFVQAGRGLAAAHAEGIVHRDFKPSNVVLGDNGRVTVLDFGLARTLGASVTMDSARLRAGVEAPAGLTESHTLVGTPLYMSPEQFEQRPVGARSDQFSLCVSLYEALSGARPFVGTTLAELAAAVCAGEFEVPRGSDAPAWLWAVVRRGLHVDPDARFGSMDALVRALAGPPRRWWRRPGLWATVAVGSVAAGAVALVEPASSPEPCTGAAAKVAPVWGQSSRAAVQTAFGESKLPYAVDSQRVASETLDDYVDKWSTEYREACEATHVRGEQSEALLDRRMACLGERLAAVDSMVEVLREADDAVINNAVKAVQRLPDLDPCTDVAALLGEGAGLDPEAQRARDGYQQALARAMSKRHAGRYDTAREQVDALLTEIGDRDRQAKAEVQIELGVLQESRGDHQQSEATLQQALWNAIAVGDTKLQLSAVTTLMTVVGWQLRRADEGRQWGLMAEALLDNRGRPPLLVAQVHSALANIEYSAGKFEDALELKKSALAIEQEHRPAGALRLSRLHNNLGLFHKDLGNTDQSLSHYEKALEIRLAVLGPAHPRTADVYNGLAGRLRDAGRLDESIEMLERALKIWSEALGSEHSKVAMAHTNLGNSLATVHRDAEALEHYQQAISIWSAAKGNHGARLAAVRGNAGLLALRMGQTQDAISQLQESLTGYDTLLGPDHPDTAATLINLSLAHRAAGSHELAIDFGERAATIVATQRTKNHSLYPLAVIAWAGGCERLASWRKRRHGPVRRSASTGRSRRPRSTLRRPSSSWRRSWSPLAPLRAANKRGRWSGRRSLGSTTSR